MIATSADGGRTLSKAYPDRALIEPPAQASFIRLTKPKANDRGRLLFANPAAPKRERLTVRVSDDDGATWPVARVVHLAALSDGTIGLLFEQGDRSPYEKITFARFGLEWLTKGKDK